MAGAVGLSPLAVGSAHRPVLTGLLIVVGMALVALHFGLLYAGRGMRIGVSALLPSVFVLISALQLVPLPASLRNAIDPAGGDLLANALDPTGAHPLSLDLPSTWRELGKAAATLAAFLFAYHWGSGRRAPRRMIYVVAGSGIVALALGLGQAAMGEHLIFGHFRTGATLLVVGPFVNRNHTAEFLELAAFACLSLVLLARNVWTMWAWIAGTAALAAGAISTLSRGSLLALAAGGLAFVALSPAGDEGAISHRRMPWKRILLLTAIGTMAIAGSLGAWAMMDRLTPADLGNEVRPSLWADSLSVFRAHHFGIGRGAFEYVYPAYQNPQAVKAPTSIRFPYVENGLLQLLIDTGWVGLALIVIATGFLIREVWRSGLGRVEAALVAGCIAILVHNLTDFGLELAGLAVPFAAILGTAIGRARPPEAPGSRAAMVAPWLATAGLVGGIVSICLPWSRNFDADLHETQTRDGRIKLAREAQRAHPVDYFYVLNEAMAQPLRGNGSESPRLASLNRSLRLCPNCPMVNAEVADALWDLGLHSQALAQFRETIRRDASAGHEAAGYALGALRRKEASPDQVARLDVGNPAVQIVIADELISRGACPLARQILSLIPSSHAKAGSFFATKYRAEVSDGDLVAASATLGAWQALQPTDARLFSARADLAARQGRSDEAAAILESGTRANPTDSQLANERIAQSIGRKRWTEAARGIEDLRRMLLERARPTLEAFIWSARLESAMGHAARAVSQYEAAVAQDPGNAALWLELGTTAESSGQLEVAVRAFGHVVQLVPTHATARGALERLSRRRVEIQRQALMPQP
jgi:tetratricopeptide (TPR) repeat protein